MHMGKGLTQLCAVCVQVIDLIFSHSVKRLPTKYHIRKRAAYRFESIGEKHSVEIMPGIKVLVEPMNMAAFS